jgi:mannose-6-phosphate isomerase-like protein (cupin superfamily)
MESEGKNRAINVPVGTDRFNNNEATIWGSLPLADKLSSHDTGGQLYIFEHRNQGKGGPPRHVHFDQDEWFYVVKGEYAFEIGGEKFRLRAGDTMFAPRKVAHGWANIGDEPGTLLTLVSPVGTFEEFLHETTRHTALPPQEEIERTFAAHNMKVVGPPLDVENP